jgi:hypothetical protein
MLTFARSWRAFSDPVQEILGNSKSRIGRASNGPILGQMHQDWFGVRLITHSSATPCISRRSWVADSIGRPPRPRQITQGTSKEHLRRPSEHIKTSHIDVLMSTGYARLMRTTLTLDDDVAMLLKKFSEESGLTFRQAVNQSIRRGLIPQALGESITIPQPRSMGRPTVDLTQALSLIESLDDEKISRSLKSSHDRS